MIYLASPYSDPDPAIRDQRYLAACRATVRLLLTGQTVFSPIVHGHGLVPFGLPTDWPFWAQQGKSEIKSPSWEKWGNRGEFGVG